MSGFVYLWFDYKRKKYYIGSHWGTEDDGYICSSDSMREAYRRRPQDFKRRVISTITTNRNDLLLEEQRYLDMIKPKEFGCKYYNINKNVFNFSWWVNENTRSLVSEKIRISNTGKKHSKKTIQKMRNIKLGKKNKPHTKETKEKLRQANIGKKLSDNTKNKIRLSRIGIVCSKETKLKISIAQKGKKLSEKHKENLRKPKRKKI